MTTSLRVLTYNVQMRSWAMEVGAQSSLTPYENVEQRADRIADRILKAPGGYDILCLQEVFDEDGRERLISKLGAAYPFRVEKADGDGVSTACATFFGVAGFAALIPGGALLAIVAGVIGLILLPFSEFEDSGLMLFSKLPIDGIPMPQLLLDSYAERGMTIPATIPAVAFVKYDDSDDGDAWAAKGALYARLIRGDGRPIHIVNSHTQADSTDDVEGNKGTRRKQLQQAFELISLMVPNVSEEEILFCGDLNVDGMNHPTTGYRQEWRERFDDPTQPFTDKMLDAWVREQCPGTFGSGLAMLPDDCDRGMTAHNQRLDYALRGRGPSSNRLLLQHMCIAYEIANDPAAPTVYTSDHLPLRIDLDTDRSYASVLTAERIDLPIGGPDLDVSDVLFEGQMHWYRIDRPGSYRIELLNGAPRIHLDVFTYDNLSVPVAPFNVLDDQGPRNQAQSRYGLPSAPFFIRLSLPDRQDRLSYAVRFHRHDGTSPFDAIALLRNARTPGFARSNMAHNLDDPTTPFNEEDSVWFVAPFDAEKDGSLRVNSTITVGNRRGAFGLLVLGRRPGGPVERLDEQPPSRNVTSTVSYNEPMTGYILVKRHDPTFTETDFTVELRSDISYLYGNPFGVGSRAFAMARLFCHDETNGALGSEWGSDDIQINVRAGGILRVHIPNSDELEFDDDSQRDLPQIDVVRYAGNAEFELVELDSLSAADRATISIPQFAALPGTGEAIGGGAFRSQVLLSAVFNKADDEDDDDDGVYDLTITISPEPPPQV